MLASRHSCLSVIFYLVFLPLHITFTTTSSSCFVSLTSLHPLQSLSLCLYPTLPYTPFNPPYIIDWQVVARKAAAPISRRTQANISCSCSIGRIAFSRLIREGVSLPSHKPSSVPSPYHYHYSHSLSIPPWQQRHHRSQTLQTSLVVRSRAGLPVFVNSTRASCLIDMPSCMPILF